MYISNLLNTPAALVYVPLSLLQGTRSGGLLFYVGPVGGLGQHAQTCSLRCDAWHFGRIIIICARRCWQEVWFPNMLKQVASRQSRGGSKGQRQWRGVVTVGKLCATLSYPVDVADRTPHCGHLVPLPTLSSRSSPLPSLSFGARRKCEIFLEHSSFFWLPSSNGIFSLERILLAFLQRNFHENFPHIVLQHLWGSLFSPPFCPLPLSLFINLSIKCSWK